MYYEYIVKYQKSNCNWNSNWKILWNKQMLLISFYKQNPELQLSNASNEYIVWYQLYYQTLKLF